MMSARQVFQHAFAHAELTRPPDAYPDRLPEIPTDCLAFMNILNWYSMEDGVGQFIYDHHPQLVARIRPALAAGLGPCNTRPTKLQWSLLKHGTELTRNHVIALAQTALNELEDSNPQPAIPKSNSETNVPKARDDEPEQANQPQNARPAGDTELEEVNIKPEEPHSTNENEGPVIHKSYPEIAAEILPALRESLNTLVQRYTTHTLPREFINHYFTRLAQTALDELQKYTIHPLPKELADKYVTRLAQTAIDELKEHSNL